jgi:hypothetical protein
LPVKDAGALGDLTVGLRVLNLELHVLREVHLGKALRATVLHVGEASNEQLFLFWLGRILFDHSMLEEHGRSTMNLIVLEMCEALK